MLVLLVPRELQVEHSGSVKEMTDQQIEDAIAAIKQMIAEAQKAIEKVMKTQPAIFLKMLVLLVPRELQIEHRGGVKGMTEEQIVDAIEAIEGFLARRAGEQAK